jgi:hypothetical protein
MPASLRCLKCEGDLVWTGKQVSCTACGSVFTLSGRPAKRGIGMLLFGLGIGACLGFVGAYEMNRFVEFRASVTTTQATETTSETISVDEPTEQPVAAPPVSGE